MAEPELSFEDHDVWREPPKKTHRVYTIVIFYSDNSVAYIHAHSEERLRYHTAGLDNSIKQIRHERWFAGPPKDRVPVSYRVDSDWPYGNSRDYY